MSSSDKGVKLTKYRDFSEMPDDVLRSLANDMAKISSGKTLKEVRAERHLALENPTHD